MGPSSASKNSIDSRQATFAAANAAEAKKSLSTVVLDVRQVTLIADYFVIAGGDSTNQVRAIVDSVDEELSKLGYRQRSIEGKADGRWVLLDYGDIIVHVLHEKERNFYKLEQFWNNGLIVPKVEWERSE
ncbi:MAG: ribosome silencing factor [Candidatus Obscuribacterales bacterium]